MSAFVITDDEKKELEGFLETFPTPLHNKLPESRYHLHVFWSQDDDHEILQQQQGFQIHNNNNNDSLSADVDTRTRWRRMISYKIKQAFLCANVYGPVVPSIIQFWAPVMTISGRRLLSTSGQPFAVTWPWKPLSKYRRRCMEYQYSIDDQHDHDPMAMVISSDTPTVSTAFLNRLPQLVSFEDLKGATSPLNYSCMLPLCFPSQTTSSSCIGVLEISTAYILDYSENLFPMIRALKEAGLGVFEIQERIPYQIIPGLKPARDEIEHALPIVCESNNIDLAQVWIAFHGDNHMPFSSFSEATQKNQMLSFKLTGYLRDTGSKDYECYSYNEYYRLCDMFPLEMGKDFVEKTLEDFKPRFCNDVSKLRPYTWVNELFYDGGSRLAICLNSIHTGDFCYAFEFMWGVESVEDDSDSDVKFVEELLSKLKELLPRFKLASGAELGDELDFLRVDDSTSTETKFMKIFQGKRLSPTHGVLEEGRTPVSVVVDYIEPLEAKSKKAPILLSREVIEQQFVDTEEIEATEKLKGAKLVEKFNVSGVEFVEMPSQISSYMNYPQQSVKEIQTLDNYVAPSERTCTITRTLLPQQVTEGLFEDTIEEATQKEPGDESDVPDVENSTRNEKTLQENIVLLVPEALERGKKTMVENCMAPSQRKYKTAPIHVSKEAIEHQYGNTMKKAAENLKDEFELKGSNIIDDIPKLFHPYIKEIKNVKGDGNCGFRALAVCLKLDEENEYESIRQQMREELQNQYDKYSRFFDVKFLKESLCFSGSPCPKKYWMRMPEAGVLIANKFGIIVHCLNMSGSTTIFPFWSGPKESQNHQALTIALVNDESHYVMVELYEGYPMPFITPYWNSHNIDVSAERWKTIYRPRLEQYNQLCWHNTGFVDLVPDITDVESSIRSENILPKALEKGKKPMVENYITPSVKKHKTAPITLSPEAIKHQYGKTMKEAAKSLNVSVSTLKRKCKCYGISEWQGPAKRKINDSRNQSAKNEEDIGAIQESFAVNRNEDILTIKAEYKGDMIAFCPHILQTTVLTVKEEIGKKLNLTRGTYKLKYLDEDKDWILLDSDQDMSNCIKSSRNSGRIVVRLLVLPSTQQPIPGPIDEFL